MKNPTAPLETTLENFHECEWKKRAEKAEAQVDRVNDYADLLCQEGRFGSKIHRIGLDIKAAIKGDKS